MSLLVRPDISFSAGRQTPHTYYEILELSPEEQDPRIIEEAAVVCSERVRAYQLTYEAECTLGLKEIAEALIVLLDPVRRREYDLSTGKSPGPALPERRPPGGRDPPVSLRGMSVSVTLVEDSVVRRMSQRKACDVKLVCRGVLRERPSRR